jgi:hypothetical protein
VRSEYRREMYNCNTLFVQFFVFSVCHQVRYILNHTHTLAHYIHKPPSLNTPTPSPHLQHKSPVSRSLGYHRKAKKDIAITNINPFLEPASLTSQGRIYNICSRLFPSSKQQQQQKSKTKGEEHRRTEYAAGYRTEKDDNAAEKVGRIAVYTG